jgi:hypothetical protein
VTILQKIISVEETTAFTQKILVLRRETLTILHGSLYLQKKLQHLFTQDSMCIIYSVYFSTEEFKQDIAKITVTKSGLVVTASSLLAVRD